MNFRAHLCIGLGLVGVVFCGYALAHPFPTEELGRFTELTLRRDGVEVKYTVTLTQLLAIEEIALMNTNGDTKVSEEEKKAYFAELRRTLREGLKLELDGEPVEVKIAQGIELKPPFYRILHYRCDFEPLTPGRHRVFFADDNYPNMPGPVEITAKASDDLELLSEANVDLSKKYQELQAAGAPSTSLQIRELEIVFRVAGGETAAVEKSPPDEPEIVEIKGPPPTGLRDKRPQPKGPFDRLWAWSAEKMSQLANRLFSGEIVGMKGIALVFAAFILIGAAHALTPGHGKTIVAAYLIGSKGRVSDAVFLGIVVTVTHTASVVVLGVVVKLLKDVILPARLNPFIASASGLLIFGMGMGLLISRTRRALMRHDHAGSHNHEHHHDHDHEGSGHHVLPEGAVTMASLLSLGVAGGIVPCPDALAVLLTAINFNHMLLGLALLIAFSVGLAAVLIAIGVLMVMGKMRLSRGAEESKLVRFYLPVASAVVIAILGAVMAVVPLVRANILSIRINLPAG